MKGEQEIFKIYPNPVDNILNVLLPDTNESIIVEVVNMMGTNIMKEYFQGITTATMHLNSIPPGPYILKVSMNKSVVNKKIIKK
jgi:hypothetical protein